jgi:Ca-activated chloride channel family protein
MAKRPNLYALLGLLRSATQDDIRRAYLKSAKRLHPDANIAPGETEIFLDVQQAYQILSDPARRSSYDATLSPEEKAPSIVEQNILFSRKELPRLKEPQLVYVLLNLAPTEEQRKETASAPLNVCLVLDCSTSMKGEKLDIVKATAVQLMRRLKAQDIFSVVSFSDRAEVVIPATRQANLQRSENRIHMLQTSGGTEIFRGLEVGLAEVRRYASQKSINHIILLTDGRTYGDEQSCYELAQTAKKENIGISGMGIGSGWNDVFLDQIATSTGGSAMFVSQPKDIERLLNEKFTHLTQAFAENVTLEYETLGEVSLNYAFRLRPETTPLASEHPLVLGPILHDESLSVLFEFRVQPQLNQQDEVEILRGRIEIASAAAATLLPPIPLNLSLPVRDMPTPAPPPTALIQALSKLTLYRIQEKARTEVASGHYDKASEHLQNMATHLLARGERSLARTIMLEAEHIEKEKSFSESGDKRIKYGTRALLLPGERPK